MTGDGRGAFGSDQNYERLGRDGAALRILKRDRDARGVPRAVDYHRALLDHGERRRGLKRRSDGDRFVQPGHHITSVHDVERGIVARSGRNAVGFPVWLPARFMKKGLRLLLARGGRRGDEEGTPRLGTEEEATLASRRNQLRIGFDPGTDGGYHDGVDQP